MSRSLLTKTYRITAVTAIVLAPFGLVHEGFAYAALVVAVLTGLVHRELRPELYRARGAAPVGARYNPATGLPMSGSFDIAGNPHGTNLRHPRN